MVLNAMEAELEVARKIFWLLRHDHVFLGDWNEETGEHDEGAYPAIKCDDLFAVGAAAEQLAAEDLDLFISVCKRFPMWGPYAWCAVKKSEDPWRQGDVGGYDKAVDGVIEMLGGKLIEVPYEVP